MNPQEFSLLSHLLFVVNVLQFIFYLSLKSSHKCIVEDLYTVFISILFLILYIVCVKSSLVSNVTISGIFTLLSSVFYRLHFTTSHIQSGMVTLLSLLWLFICYPLDLVIYVISDNTTLPSSIFHNFFFSKIQS